MRGGHRRVSNVSLKRTVSTYETPGPPAPLTLQGVITDVEFDVRLVWICANNGKLFKASTNNFYNSPGKHGCIAQAGDEVRFVTSQDRGVKEIYFCTVPEVQMAEEEISQVTIVGGIIWGERLAPNCGCSIVLGRAEDYPQLRVGDRVRHRIGVVAGKIQAVKVQKDQGEV